ncbi:MAG TPA: hypothetical protein DEO71_03575 [Chryseobacterium sp.]|nr:hypothetical protein [Chryseobacterium sp.]
MVSKKVKKGIRCPNVIHPPSPLKKTNSIRRLMELFYGKKSRMQDVNFGGSISKHDEQVFFNIKKLRS